MYWGIATLNKNTLLKIETNPRQFGFEPYERTGLVIWCKYNKKDIIWNIPINYKTVNKKQCRHIIGLVFISNYYTLEFDSKKSYWKRQ